MSCLSDFSDQQSEGISTFFDLDVFSLQETPDMSVYLFALAITDYVAQNSSDPVSGNLI